MSSGLPEWKPGNRGRPRATLDALFKRNETKPMLNPKQQQVVDSTSRRVVAVAGPGSGKTHTLISRISRLVNDGINPKRICAVTFTTSAAKELERRLAETIPGRTIGFCGTLHSLMLRLLTAKRGASPTVVGKDLAETMLQDVIAELRYNGAKKDLEAAMGDRAGLGQPNAALTKAVAVARVFYRRLLQDGMLTFDMILSEGLALLEGLDISATDENGWLFDHLLVDEFQDSSDIDAKIYEALPIPFKTFCGDSDQAIYAFRKGNVMNLMRLVLDLDAEVITLETNYRSDAMICAAANNLIRHNRTRVNKRTVAASSAPGVAVCVQHETEGLENRWLGDELRRYRPEQVAVLVRTNAQAEKVRTILQANGHKVCRREIPNLPPDWAEVKHFLALMADPTNDRLAELYLARKVGPAKASQLALAAVADGLTVSKAVLGVDGAHDVVATVPEIISRAGFSVLSVVLIESTIKGLATGAEPPTMADLSLALAEIEDHSLIVQDGITVSTIHGAKGREWDVVFMPCMEQETFPGTRKDLALTIEDERRLCYVGMTRAKRGLYLSFANRRAPMYGFNAEYETTPSQFIKEAGLVATSSTIAAFIRSGQVRMPVVWETSSVAFTVDIKQKRKDQCRVNMRKNRLKTKLARAGGAA